MEAVETIVPAHYPELARLAWNRDATRPINGAEALGLYEANWRHLDVGSLSARERALIDALVARFGGGYLLTTK